MVRFSSRGINVLDVNVKPDDIAAADDNTALLARYAADGYSLYFPPGDYHISDRVIWNSANNVKLWGDGARIYQVNDLRRMFDFNDCHKVEVEGLTFHTYYYLNRSSVGDSTDSSPLYIRRCKVVQVHHNTIEGFQCHGIWVEEGADIKIDSNTFRDGHWADNFENTACIKLWRGLVSNVKPREVIITNNNCNTYALIQISAQHATRKTVISNNNCITKDENDVPLEGWAEFAPKAGIEMQYFADASGGYVGADNEDFDQLIISGNNVQGCRFSGITGQSSVRANAVHPGARTTITGNTIQYCGTTQNPGETSNLAGGINWIGYRNLIIKGNIISKIPNDGGSNGVSAIAVQGIWPRTDGSTNLGTPNSCIIQGNIIENCASRGIYLTAQNTGSANNGLGDVTIDNNTIQDIDNAESIRVVVPPGTYRAGHVHITGNKVASTKRVGQYICRVEVGTVEPAECIVSHNTFNFRDADFQSAARPIVELQVDKANVNGNRIIGDGGNAIGLNLRTLNTDKRFQELLMSTNQIHNCGTGVGSSNAVNYGPFIMNNTTITDCVTQLQNPNAVYHGHWAGDLAVVYAPSVPPAEGNWLPNDRVINSNPEDGEPDSWVCTTGGAGPASVWVPTNLIGTPTIGQLADDGGGPQSLTTTADPINAYDATANGHLNTPNVTLDAPNATIQLPDVPAGGHVYRYSLSGIFAPGGNNNSYVLELFVNGVLDPTPIAILDGRQSGTSLTFGLSGLYALGPQSSPTIQVRIRMVSGTDTIIWSSSVFSVERNLDF